MTVRVQDWIGSGKVYTLDDLDAYYRSPFWERAKTRWTEANPDARCFVCDRRDYQLHHVRYDRLGMELGDLVPLCEDHHYEIEKHLAKGIEGVTRMNAHEHYRQQWEKRRQTDRWGSEVRRASARSQTTD